MKRFAFLFLMLSHFGAIANVFSIEQQARLNLNYDEELLSSEQKTIKGTPSVHGLNRLLYIALNQETENKSPTIVMNSYKKAYQYAPYNIEPLYYFSIYLEKNNSYQEAYQVAALAWNIKDNEEKVPFLHWIYDYGLLWQYSLCAFQAGNYQEAVDLGNELLECPHLSEDQKKSVMKNMFYYQAGVQIFQFAEEHWGPVPWEIP